MIRTTAIQTTVPVELTCDRCGRIVPVSDAMEWQESLQLRFTGGYGSVFGDGTKVAVDLCQHCVKELLGAYCRVES